MNRDKILGTLFNYNSKYNDHRHKVLNKIDELETMVQDGSSKEDLFYLIDLINLNCDFIIKKERQEMQDLMFLDGNTGDYKKRHERFLKEYERNTTAKLVK